MLRKKIKDCAKANKFEYPRPHSRSCLESDKTDIFAKLSILSYPFYHKKM